MESVSLSLTLPSDSLSPRSNSLRRHPSLSLELVSPLPASESEPISTESAVAVADPMRGFKTGDIVWGLVESHPWWPGQIYNEACAVPSVHLYKVTGHVLVAFFGDGTYGWLDPSDLLPFEPHFQNLSTQVGSSSFVNAVNEAIYEMSRRAALGLACYCCSTFRPTKVPGYVTVDMPGFEPGDYSMAQIQEARRSIRPAEVLSIARELAVMPWRKEVVSVERSRRMATLLAYRSAVFEKVDETYTEAFCKEREQPKNLSIRDGAQAGKKRRLVKLRDQLPSSEDNNQKLSSTACCPTGTRPLVDQINRSPASSRAMPLMVAESDMSAKRIKKPKPSQQLGSEKDVAKLVGYVAGGTDATKGDVLLLKSCIKKADKKGTTTKQVRFSVGSMVEPPAICPSELNAARNVQLVPELPPPLTQTYGGMDHSTLALAPAGAALGLEDGGGDGRVDILPQMMALLVKCKEIVDAVKPLIGYNPI